jgi:cytochrome c oxidase assembly factor CtaG
MRRSVGGPTALRRCLRSVVAALVPVLIGSSPVAAHGEPATEPTVSTLIDAWSFDVTVWLPIVVAGLAYWLAADTVDRRHPTNRVPRWRRWAWLAGLATIVLALASPIEHYDTTLFSFHMVQHLLLALVAAPLLVMAAPITLLLRFASPEVRRRWILPVLHSAPVRVLSAPPVAWGIFAGVMWFSHFSPLFDNALEDEMLHRLEHAIFLGSALLFWWPVVGADPSPHRLSHPARLLYLALGMPLSSFLGLVIFSSRTVLYPHYVTLERDWGISPLEDQAWAGGIMWAFGDLVFVIAIVAAVAVWLRHEEAEGHRVDARLARQAQAAERAEAAARAE